MGTVQLAGSERARAAAISSPVTESAIIRDVLLLAVDDGLKVPGDIVRPAIYERIERTYELRREEIPEKLPIFHQALQDLIGGGAKVMEKLIAKNLYSRLELNFTERHGWTIVDYLNHAKRSEVNDSRHG